MQLIPIRTPLLRAGDELAAILRATTAFRANDIVVVSAKAVATTEGAAIDLSSLSVSREALEWDERLGRAEPKPAFRQAVLEETRRLGGSVIGACPNVMLAELQPDGMTHGTILAANAGLDGSNIPEGHAIGWPRDPVRSVRSLRGSLESFLPGNAADTPRCAVILSDSCCRPRRWGVTAYALVVSGLDPIVSQIGREDLFGKKLQMTQEAVADQLATAANFLMGNADQSTPAVIIRDHGLTLSTYEGWVPGINPEEDLFRGMV